MKDNFIENSFKLLFQCLELAVLYLISPWIAYHDFETTLFTTAIITFHYGIQFQIIITLIEFWGEQVNWFDCKIILNPHY